MPVMTDIYGIVPVTASTLLNVPLIVNGLSPSSVNPFGGNTVTITGQNFPGTMDDAAPFTVTFANGSPCTILSTSYTSITCLTGPYSPSAASSVMSLQVNTETDTSQSVSLGAQNPVITSIEPALASPVLKAPLTLQVNNWVHTLVKADLSVTLVGVDHPEWVEPLNIVEISNTANAKYIKVMYGGAYSGNYSIVVNSAQYGNFDTTGLFFQAIGTVTSWSPVQGSVHGGTLITINGYNFSNAAFTDNPVQVGYTDCLVQSTSNTQITCLTQPRRSGDAGTDDLIVFLRTFEMAVFQVNETFEWVADGLPNITSYETYFDTGLEDWILVLDGTGFGTDPSVVEVFIDDILQSTLTCNDTTITVQITATLTDSTSNIDVFFPIGTPDGEGVFVPNGIALTPMMLDINPKTTSPGGSIIEVTVPGLGPNSAGVSLVNAAGSSVCVSVSIPSYGKLLCHTKPGAMATSTLSVKQNSVTYPCSGASGACDI